MKHNIYISDKHILALRYINQEFYYLIDSFNSKGDITTYQYNEMFAVLSAFRYTENISETTFKMLTKILSDLYVYQRHNIQLRKLCERRFIINA